MIISIKCILHICCIRSYVTLVVTGNYWEVFAKTFAKLYQNLQVELINE